MTKHSEEKFEPTVNPIIARLKAQAGIKVDDVEEDAQSDSRFSLLGPKARAALKASLSDDSAEAVQIDADAIIAHSGDNKSVQSERVRNAKLHPNDDQYKTPRMNLEVQGLLPGKANVKSGIYKMTFEDGCYIIGYAGDMYAKMVGVISRINRNVIPRYPRGTEVLSFEVLSYSKSDLAQCKKDHKDDPKFIVKLGRTKAKKSGGSVIERYKARKAGKDKANVKSHSAVQAHREEQKRTGGMSALERLRAKGGQIKAIETPDTKPVSMDVAQDALAELDAAFQEFEPRITSTIYVPQSNVNLDWDAANMKWITRKP